MGVTRDPKIARGAFYCDVGNQSSYRLGRARVRQAPSLPAAAPMQSVLRQILLAWRTPVPHAMFLMNPSVAGQRDRDLPPILFTTHERESRGNQAQCGRDPERT